MNNTFKEDLFKNRIAVVTGGHLELVKNQQKF